MDNKSVSEKIGLPVRDVQQFMNMDAMTLLKSPAYIALLKSIDRELLADTLNEARAAYEAGLPAFEADLNERYGIESTPMSAYTLGNWVVGALQYPENIDQILKMHHNVPGNVVTNGLDDLLAMLDNLPAEAATEWQRALTALSLPLMKT